MKGGFYLYNGRFVKEHDHIFSAGELQRFGAGFTESFRAESNEVLFIDEIYQHLIDSAKATRLSMPENYDEFGTQFRRDVSRLLNKNKLYLSARIVVQLFPGATGSDILLSATELPREFYPMAPNGLLLNTLSEHHKTISESGNYEPASRYIWTMAALEATTTGRHNMLICNTDNHACEIIGGTFAMIRDNQLYFPAPASGGYQSPITAKIAEAATSAGFSTSYKINLTLEELLDADELFAIDNCLGMQKILGLHERRYYSFKTEAIWHRFTDMARLYRKLKN